MAVQVSQAVNAMLTQQRKQAMQRLQSMAVPSIAKPQAAVKAEAKKEARADAYLRRAAEAEEHRQKQVIIERNKRPERVRELSVEEWHERFEREGHEVILNAIACGFTVAAWAVERGFPPGIFYEWCEEHLDRKRVVAANRAAADLAAFESLTVFDDPESKATMQGVHHARARAQHKTWMAERRDADRWGPPKAVPPQQAPVALNVYMGTGDVPTDIQQQIADKKATKLAAAPARFDPRNDKITKQFNAEDGEVVDEWSGAKDREHYNR